MTIGPIGSNLIASEIADIRLRCLDLALQGAVAKMHKQGVSVSPTLVTDHAKVYAQWVLGVTP